MTPGLSPRIAPASETFSLTSSNADLPVWAMQATYEVKVYA
jgi:hypothetical protein